MISRRSLRPHDSSPWAVPAGGDQEDAASKRLRLSGKRPLWKKDDLALSPPVPTPLSWQKQQAVHDADSEESSGAGFHQPPQKSSGQSFREQRQRATETPSPERPGSVMRGRSVERSSRRPSSSSACERPVMRRRSRSPQRRPAAPRTVAVRSKDMEACTVCREPIEPGEARYRGYLPQHEECGKVARAERDFMKSRPEVSFVSSQSVKLEHLSQAFQVKSVSKGLPETLK